MNLTNGLKPPIYLAERIGSFVDQQESHTSITLPHLVEHVDLNIRGLIQQQELVNRTFHHFPRLPFEIQSMIWEYSLETEPLGGVLRPYHGVYTIEKDRFVYRGWQVPMRKTVKAVRCSSMLKMGKVAFPAALKQRRYQQTAFKSETIPTLPIDIILLPYLEVDEEGTIKGRDDFLANANNQKYITDLAIFAVGFKFEENEHSFTTATTTLKCLTVVNFLQGLKNLKTGYVIFRPRELLLADGVHHRWEKDAKALLENNLVAADRTERKLRIELLELIVPRPYETPDFHDTGPQIINRLLLGEFIKS